MRKKISLLFAVSLVGLSIGYFFLKIYNCGYSVFCYNFETRISGLFFGSLALSVIFLILLFIPRAWGAWKRFAIWFIPLAVLLFAWYPDPGSGDYFSPYPEQVFQWVSALYIGASLGIIATSLVNDWRKKKGRAPLATFWYWLAAIALSVPALYLFNPLVKLVLSGLVVVFNLFS